MQSDENAPHRVPGDRPALEVEPSESEKAALSQARGKTAASLQQRGATPQEVQKFIAAQGEAEAAGKLTPAAASRLAPQSAIEMPSK
jgi:hypothetical protein